MINLLKDTIIVQRKTRISDDQGGWKESWSAVGTIRGRIRPASSSERMAASQMGARISHVLYCRAGEEIRRGDRALLNTNTLSLEVVVVRKPSLGKHWEIDCWSEQHG